MMESETNGEHMSALLEPQMEVNLESVKTEQRDEVDDSSPPPSEVVDHIITSHESTQSFNAYRKRSETHSQLLNLTVDLQDQGSNLFQTWSSLNELLSKYKAELISKENESLASKAKFEGVTDIEELKNELIQKDNENSNLVQRLNDLESQNQVIQMDLSVKDSLLKKYQQDLLDKEANVLTLQSNNKRLENKLSVLETKLATRPGQMMSPSKQLPPRLSMAQRGRPPMQRSPIRSPMRSPAMQRNLGDRSLLHHTPAGFKRRFPSPQTMSPPKRQFRQPPQFHQQQQQLSPLIPSQQQSMSPQHPMSSQSSIMTSMAAMTSSTATTSSQDLQETKPPIVCIEVDDDDEIEEIAQAASRSSSVQSVNDPLYTSNVEHYSEGTDNEGQDSMPGQFDEYKDFSDQQLHHPFPIGDAQMAMPQGLDAMALQAQEMGVFDDGTMQMHDMSATSPMKIGPDGKAKIPCNACDKLFSTKCTLVRHQKIKHQGELRYSCAQCGKRFGQHVELKKHMEANCNQCLAMFSCMEDLKAHKNCVHGGRNWTV